MIENQFGEFFPPTLDKSGNQYNSQFTLRDYFAAKATDVDINRTLSEMSMEDCVNRSSSENRAIARYIFADAMMNARENKRGYKWIAEKRLKR